MLLILAGVAINFALGENGILKGAETAVDKYQNKAEQEQNELAKIDDYIQNGRENNENVNNYSTNEQIIGTWIDGKKLYRKVYQTTTPTTNTRETIVDTTNLNIDIPVNVYGYIILNDSGAFDRLNIYYGPSDFISTVFYRSGVNMWTPYINRQNKPCIIVIEYTKTTD